MKKYRVTSLSYNPKIGSYKFIRETPKTITYEYVGFRKEIVTATEYKDTTYYKWFDTFEEAKAHVINDINKKIERCRQDIIMYEEWIRDITALQDEQ